MVARLAARIAKLEKAMPKPIPGCDVCRHSFVWCDDEIDRVAVDGQEGWACRSCKAVLTRPFKLIVGVDSSLL